MDSTILDNNKKAINLQKLIKFPTTKKWKLKYRATKDGFSKENFHSKCDGTANTLTIIKSTNGNIFGGFTEKAWNSTSGRVLDPKAFVFSLVNKENKPFKVMCKNGADAIWCSSWHGLIFGAGHDILIASDSNSNKESYSNLGPSYDHADPSILAGSYNFQTLEIEVFTEA